MYRNTWLICFSTQTGAFHVLILKHVNAPWHILYVWMCKIMQIIFLSTCLSVYCWVFYACLLQVRLAAAASAIKFFYDQFITSTVSWCLNAFVITWPSQQSTLALLYNITMVLCVKRVLSGLKKTAENKIKFSDWWMKKKINMCHTVHLHYNINLLSISKKMLYTLWVKALKDSICASVCMWMWVIVVPCSSS